MAVYIIAALEVSMLPALPASVQFQDVTSQERKLLAKGAKSAVTNQPLAAAFSKLLGGGSGHQSLHIRPGSSWQYTSPGEYNGPPHSYIEDGVIPPGGGVRWVKIQL